VCQSQHAQSIPMPTESTCCRVTPRPACCWNNLYGIISCFRLLWCVLLVQWGRPLCQHPVPIRYRFGKLVLYGRSRPFWCQLKACMPFTIKLPLKSCACLLLFPQRITIYWSKITNFCTPRPTCIQRSSLGGHHVRS